jgi:hypothetical protein
MKIDLPPRWLTGRVRRVNLDGTFQCMLHLGFGVHFEKRVHVEALTLRNLSKEQHDAAHHCLLVLMGGKDIYALTQYADGVEQAAPSHVMARVYLAVRVKDLQAPGLSTVPGVSHPVLAISDFMSYLATKRYDVEVVKHVLNGGP